MPVYKERQIGKYLATVKPSGFKRGLIRRAPFYNGSYVCFDLLLRSKAEKIDKENISIDWELWDRSKNKMLKQDQNTYEISNAKQELKKTDRQYRFSGNRYENRFTILRAIEIGDLWDLDTYDLLVKEAESTKVKEIITEFTLQDIDVYGSRFVNALITAGIAAVVSGLVSAIILWIYGEF